MVASETRANARKALTGKWGKVALMTLLYAVLIYIINFALAFIPVIGSIIATVITLPLSYGFLVTFMNLKRGEEAKYTTFCTEGFNNFGKAWLVTLRIFLKMIIPLILLIVSYVILFVGLGSTIYGVSALTTSATSVGAVLIVIGTVALIASGIYSIVKYYLYTLSFNILRDNPDMAPKDIVEESAKLMKGNRLSLFELQLSFIGWVILASFTLGIGYLWLYPYISVATIDFYEQLAGKTTVEAKVEESTEENPIQEL